MKCPLEERLLQLYLEASVGSKQFISMVDVVCGRGVSGGVETDVGELYSISTLAEMCLLGRRVPEDLQFIFHLHHQGR